MRLIWLGAQLGKGLEAAMSWKSPWEREEDSVWSRAWAVGHPSQLVGKSLEDSK